MKHYISRKMFLRILRSSLIAALTLAVSDIADALVIGNSMGMNGLAAVGIVTPVYLFLNFAGYSFSTGGGVTHSRLAAEGLCMVTIEQAFTGKADEYIQLTLAREVDGGYILHIRNSAPFFNPLDLKMARMSRDAEEELMDSIGVMMVKEKVKSLRFRHYQGFNLMTVAI